MSNKKSISVRLVTADLRRVKTIATRLAVKESDVFRFSIKSVMNQLMPMLDNDVHGAAMLLAFVDCGEELLRYFEFDVQQLNKVINGEVGENDRPVDIEDLRLLSIASVNPGYLALKLSEAFAREVAPTEAYATLREYFHEKYQGESAVGMMLEAASS